MGIGNGRWVGRVGVAGMIVLLAACAFAPEDRVNPFASGGSSASGGGEGGASGAGGGGTGGDATSNTTSAGGGGSGGGGVDACVPSDMPLDPTCDGIFVDTSLLNGGDGSRGSPYNNWQAAFDDPNAGNKTIYMCIGQQYTNASVRIGVGVSVWGGLDCAQDAWTLSGAGRTTSFGPADAIALVVEADPGTVLRRLSVAAEDATVDGGSSIAVLVNGGSLVADSCAFTAGTARDGKPGATGANGSKGADGDPGGDVSACNLASKNGTMFGPPGSPPPCGGVGASGGGTGASSVMTNGVASFINATAGGSAAGTLGAAGASGSACSFGGNGVPGQSGQTGLGGTADGTLTPDGYVGDDGKPGADGAVAGGGGGGGASLGGACGGSNYQIGAAGGAGGTGGCGGLAGMGGQAGGSSISVVALNAAITLSNTSLITMSAGDGGDGRSGGIGGAGGLGGAGGKSAGSYFGGCAGGSGGAGGPGGQGGGGHGGHSIGVAYTLQAPILTNVVVALPGSAAAGGLAQNSGSAGQVADTMAF